MRVAVLHPQTAFVRGGAELHAEGLLRALRGSGHEADLVTIAGKWYPPTELVHQMAVWRSFDISESEGRPVDAVIALKFPSYLVQHERKIVWLIHQHRSAYELWDHPEFADLSRQEGGETVRRLIWSSDRQALGEAKRIFTNSKNVADRLWSSLRLPGTPLYHRSPAADRLLGETPRELGDYLLYPSRMDLIKRHALGVEAMRHVRTPVQLVLVGRGNEERSLREQVRRLGLQERVRIEVGIPEDRLLELYLGSLGTFFGAFDEDYGYVPIESFAAARPVVTLTDSGGALEFVADQETGLVVVPEPEAIADAFDRLWEDRQAAATWGAAGRRAVLERVPAWPEIVEQLLA
jgi:glycosyltransferase involved in cell wall biosynthesis